MIVIELVLLIAAVALWFRISKAITAVTESEKHLRVIAWEAEKRGRAESKLPGEG